MQWPVLAASILSTTYRCSSTLVTRAVAWCLRVTANLAYIGPASLQDSCNADELAFTNVGCSGSGPVVLMFFEEEQPITARMNLWLCDKPPPLLKERPTRLLSGCKEL